MKGKKSRERTLKKKELKGKCRPQNAMKSEQAYLFLVNCGFAPRFTIKAWQCPWGLVSRSPRYDWCWVASPHAWPGVKWLINTWRLGGGGGGGCVHPPVERLQPIVQTDTTDPLLGSRKTGGFDKIQLHYLYHSIIMIEISHHLLNWQRLL